MSAHIAFEELVKDVVRSIRGDRTQGQINRRLGYTSNKISKWERGEQSPRWHEFLKLCEVSDIDVTDACFRHLGHPPSADDPLALVLHLAANHSPKSIANAGYKSLSSVYRLLRGENAVGLSDVLILIDLCGLLEKFLQSIVEIARLPTLKGATCDKKRTLEFFSRYPVGLALMEFLKLTPYQRYRGNRSELVAARLGLPKEEVEDLYSQLTHYGFIRPESGKYVSLFDQLSTSWETEQEYDQAKDIQSFWMEYCKRVFESETREQRASSTGYYVLPVDQESWRLISEETIRFLVKVAKLSSATGNPDKLCALNIQLVDMWKAGQMGVS